MTKTTIEATMGRDEAAAVIRDILDCTPNPRPQDEAALRVALAALSQGEGEARCAECGAELEAVRPGKHQHPTCSQGEWMRLGGLLPAPLAEPDRWPPNYANGWNDALKMMLPYTGTTHHPEAQQPEAVAWWEVTAKPIWDESEPPETFVVPGPNKPTDGKTPGLELVSVRPLIYGDTTPPKPAEATTPTHDGGGVRALVESVARAIYDEWRDKPGFVGWVDRGNSDMQDEARFIARRAINEALTPATPQGGRNDV